MKNYNVTIEDEENEKSFNVNVNSREEFIEWIELLSSFEKSKKIHFEEISDEDEELKEGF
jgi:hypothetical protein